MCAHEVSRSMLINLDMTYLECGFVLFSIDPSTCTELGFIDRCCIDELNLGYCEIELPNGVMCSCHSSCFVDNTCCSDIGCVRMSWWLHKSNIMWWYQNLATTCSEAGLDPGCCEGNCTVDSGNEVCYCDEKCHDKGDCCEDVDQTKDCNKKCTLTIGKCTI